MDENEIRKALNSIRLSDNAKERITENCTNIINSAKSDDGFERIYIAERVPNRSFKRAFSAFAACFILVGGIGVTLKIINNTSAEDISSASEASSTDAKPTSKNFYDLLPSLTDAYCTYADSVQLICDDISYFHRTFTFMELDKLLDRMASEIRISENDAVNSDSPHIVINCIETSISFFSDNTITVERSVNGESERYRYICEDSSFMEKLEIMVKNPRFDELCPSCSKFDCLDGPVYVTWNNKYFELSNSQFKKLDSTFSLISQDVYATYPSKNFENSEFDSIFYTNKNVNTEIRLYDESIFCMVVKDEDFERTDTYWYECETGHSLKNEVEKIISEN